MSNISNLEDYRIPTPSIKNSKVTNTRKYKDVREREYLTSSEIELISKAAKSVGRHGHRDSTIITIAYHHALRVSELVNLKWSQIDLSQGLIHMNGRVYDYNLGRFMSVDPFIQSPLNSQSLNPYTYIMNNPMAGVDPTGYVAQGTNASNWRTSGCDLDPMGCTSTPTEKAFSAYVGSGESNMHQSFSDNLEKFNNRMEQQLEDNWTDHAYAGLTSVTITDLPSSTSGDSDQKQPPSFSIKDPNTIDEFTLMDEVNEIAESGSIVANYFLGTGPEHRNFDENSIQSFRLSQTPEFERIREVFFKLYGEKLSGLTDWSGISATGFGKTISFIEGLQIAWDSPTGAYVGTFAAMSITGGPDRSLTYTLKNNTSLTSLTGRVFGEISFSRVNGEWRPMSNISQTYIVKEHYELD